jgi:hypothetical protein
MDEIPAVIKAKFAMFEGQVPQVVAAAQDAQQEKLETPAVEVNSAADASEDVDSAADASEDVDSPKYTQEKLESMTVKQLEDILKADFVGVPISTLKKPDLIECILNPDQEKCKKKKPVKPAPSALVAPSTDEPGTAPTAPSAPTTTYTREQLSGMSKSKLEEIFKTYPNVAWTTVGKKGRDELIDCILNPEQEKCLSKKVKKTGGAYTRKQARQHG